VANATDWMIAGASAPRASRRPMPSPPGCAARWWPRRSSAWPAAGPAALRGLRHALAEGLGAYAAAVVEPYALSAIRLTLLVAAISVPLNTVFGVCAAWAIAKFDFPGKNLLISLIDLPFPSPPSSRV